jgi:two-component system response regulator HydG
MSGKVLIVDDEPNMCQMVRDDLATRGLDAEWCTSAGEAEQKLQAEEFDVLLTDIRMPGTTGLQLCASVAANRPDIPVVVMTAFGNLQTAVEAIRAGAYDFVTKPVEMDVLALTLERAIRHRQLQQQVRLLSQQVRDTEPFDQLIGESPVMKDLYRQLARIAESEAAVLITGESGTGKELVARSMHGKSRRAAGPFVAVNCAALPAHLLESELFGHTRGAFTDAHTARKGLFLQAHAGSIFLDEIGELPLEMQAKLLRALEENRVRPVGSDREIDLDVRLLSATNRDLETAVEQGRFREDLFYRINVIQVTLPPLRARGTDVLLLAQRYLEQFAGQSRKEVRGISEAAAERLLAYNWPGNVRELRNVVERAVALTRFERIALEDLPEKVRDYRSRQVFIGGSDPSELVPMEEIERRYIRHVLEAAGDNKTLAARILGYDRKTLYRKLKAYGSA